MNELLNIPRLAEYLGVSVPAVRKWWRNYLINNNLVSSRVPAGYITPPEPDTIVNYQGNKSPRWTVATVIEHDTKAGFSANGRRLLDADNKPRSIHDSRRKYSIRNVVSATGVYTITDVAALFRRSDRTVMDWIKNRQLDYPPQRTRSGYTWTQDQYNDMRKLMQGMHLKQELAAAANVTGNTFNMWVKAGTGPQPALKFANTSYFDLHAYRWAQQQPGRLAFAYQPPPSKPERHITTDPAMTNPSVPAAVFVPAKGDQE